MTHSATVVDSGVAGDRKYAVVDVDITSLAALGAESYDPEAKHNVDTELGGAAVIDQENGGYHVSWDETNRNIVVKYADYDAASDGVLIDVPSATDVGVVRLEFRGR